MRKEKMYELEGVTFEKDPDDPDFVIMKVPALPMGLLCEALAKHQEMPKRGYGKVVEIDGVPRWLVEVRPIS